MKRGKLLAHLKKHDCTFDRHGSNHDIYINSKGDKWSAIPRHPDINEYTIMDICKQLGIPKIK